MSALHQVWIVTLLGLKGLRQRLWQSLVIVVGMACVAGVLLSMLSMTVALAHANADFGDPDLVLVLAADAKDSGGNSQIPRDQVTLAMNAPGIAHAADGSPMADAQMRFGAQMSVLQTGARGYVQVRGVGPKGLALRPKLHIVAGRMFRPGMHELIVGVGVQHRFAHAAIGDKVILPDGQWPIVGSFVIGDQEESMMFGDTDTLMASIHRRDYNTVLARVNSAADFNTLRRALAANPTLHVFAVRQGEWEKKNSGGFTTFLNVIVYGVGVLLAIGALFGCFNTMYAAVGSRAREIATLRALGFGGFAVAASVVLEAAALSVTGALIGAAYAWLRYNGVETGFGSMVFDLTVSPAMIGMIILWALAIAFLGGILPSLRAAHRPVADALRAT